MTFLFYWQLFRGWAQGAELPEGLRQRGTESSLEGAGMGEGALSLKEGSPELSWSLKAVCAASSGLLS